MNLSANICRAAHVEKFAIRPFPISIFVDWPILIAAALGSEKLDVLVNAATSFSATIQQQLETLQSDAKIVSDRHVK